MSAGQAGQHFIPMSRDEIKRNLFEISGHHTDDLKQICTLLEALWHHRMHDRQENLKRFYNDFDPDSHHTAPDSFDASTFFSEFSDTLNEGNWLIITDEEMDAALDGEDIFPISLDVRFDEFKLLKTYKLGEKTHTSEVKQNIISKLLRKKPATRNVEIYERVIQVMQFKEKAWFGEQKVMKNHPGKEGAGLHLRLFKNVPKLDLEVIFPNTSPKMRTIDQIKIVAPIVGGLVTLGMKFGPLLFGVSSGETSLALIGGIVSALGTYVLKSWSKYMKTKEAYLSQVSKDLYFKGLANNQAVINMVIDLSEEQEVKEALLAYSFILFDENINHNANSLDERIEEWLTQIGAPCDFEVEDAIGKLVELGLVNDGEFLTILAPKEALTRLDELWDCIFDY